MDQTGLLSSIYEAAAGIDSGRKGFAIEGNERKSRILFEYSIEKAMIAFQEARISGDPQIIILAEYTFLSQELQLCPKTDKNAFDSLTVAVQSFDDAFLVLDVVEDKTLYQAVDKAIPHHKKHRVKGYPKDSFHIACSSHDTRIKNILSAPGIDLIEKSLLEQRKSNLSTAQNGYIEKQKKALGM